MGDEIEYPKPLRTDGKTLTEVNQSVGGQIIRVLQKLMLHSDGGQAARVVLVLIQVKKLLLEKARVILFLGGW